VSRTGEEHGRGAAEGQVLASYHDQWDVFIDGCTVRCSVRARHFADLKPQEKLLVPGDRVLVSRVEGGASVIERVLERGTRLSRRMPGTVSDFEQIIVANADRVIAVASFRTPRLNRRLLDRYLVIAEDAGLESVVVLNKIDLESIDAVRAAAAPYEAAGYRVLPTCAVTGQGVDALRDELGGHLSVLAGPSGAGKSSLLNAIEPGLGLKVRSVSRKTGKGKHTTSNVHIFPLDASTFVADTPGFRELGFWRIEPEELPALFPEFRGYAENCRYRSCRHVPEPGCAVKEAVESGAIDEGRYESYTRLLSEIEESARRT
jgi:ribosome biogenesis GTPase